MTQGNRVEHAGEATDVSRRAFVKVAAWTAAGIAVLGLPGCAGSTTAQSQSQSNEPGAATGSDALSWWQKTIAYECYPKSFQDTGA